MKKLYTILSISALLCLGYSASAQRSNCAATPDPITLTQPDGTVLQAYIKGNEVLHYFETPDGYAVLQNPAHNGTYEYAKLDEQGNLVTSGMAVTNGKQKNLPFEKGLHHSYKQRTDANKAFYAQEKPIRFQKAANGDFPSKGKMKLLVVLMQFKDELTIYSKQSFIDLLTQDGYNVNGGTGSFREFYNNNSFGQFDLDITVMGWYTSSRNKLEYGKTDIQGNSNPSYNTNVRELVGQAVDSAETAGIDFSDYDNNKDGELDGLVIFHSGLGAEQGKNGYIWSHRSSLWGGSNRNYDGVNISNYCINPSKRDFGGLTQVRIGVVTHEFGHILGLPDLYDTDQNSEGAGNWCLMAGGPWMNSERTPCQLSAWSKSELGWITPTIISKKGAYQLKNFSDSLVAYRINTSEPNEYFLLENRQLKGWDRYLPGRGMTIWHINTDLADNYSKFGSNNVNTDTSVYGVGVVQADGKRHLELKTNRGDAGDVFPGSSNNKSFTPTSKPAALLHAFDNFGDPKSSNIFITTITLRTDSVITFDLGGKAAAGFSPSATSGCAPLLVSLSNQSNFSISYEWQFGDGTTSTEDNPVKIYTTPGTYKVTLYVYDSTQMLADSFSTNINVYKSPEALAYFSQTEDSVIFVNESNGADYYYWMFSNGISSQAFAPKLKLKGFATYQMVAFSNNGCTDTITGQIWKTGLYEQTANTIGLHVYPNPFTESTVVSYAIQQSSDVNIEVYNLLGELVYGKHISNQTSGNHEFTLDGVKTSGLYLVKVKTDNQSGVQRILKN
ncbi:MAG: M6 family metalloprotease domain-containing protein [Bacteroidota bacterium]